MRELVGNVALVTGEHTRHKITVGNASRVYSFTPADPASITVS